MLKSELIKNITSLPTTCSLFNCITKIQLSAFASDTEFRDSILKQYQFRKSNFEIVKFEDLNETIKNQIFSILSSRVQGTSKTARDFVCNYVKSLCDLTFNFLNVYDASDASKSTLSSKRKDELEKFYNDYNELYENFENEIKEKLPEFLESEVRKIITSFSKCVIYFEEKDIFKGKIGEFYDHNLSSSALDEISERTPEDCVNILVKRSAIDNTICDFYEKHPEIKD